VSSSRRLGLLPVTTTSHSNSPSLREELTRAAVAAGLGVREVQAHRLTLEDVFLSLTADEDEVESEEE